MSVWLSIKKLFSVQYSIPLKYQDWREKEYFRWLLRREGIHALLSVLTTFVVIAALGASLAARIAGPACVLAAIGLIEFVHTLRGQQPWKGVLDLLVWGLFAILAGIVF